LKEFIRTYGTKVKPGTIGYDGSGTANGILFVSVLLFSYRSVADIGLVNGIPSVMPLSNPINNSEPPPPPADTTDENQFTAARSILILT
jgi:hypothetical protein